MVTKYLKNKVIQEQTKVISHSIVTAFKNWYLFVFHAEIRCLQTPNSSYRKYIFQKASSVAQIHRPPEVRGPKITDQYL